MPTMPTEVRETISEERLSDHELRELYSALGAIPFTSTHSLPHQSRLAVAELLSRRAHLQPAAGEPMLDQAAAFCDELSKYVRHHSTCAISGSPLPIALAIDRGCTCGASDALKGAPLSPAADAGEKCKTCGGLSYVIGTGNACPGCKGTGRKPAEGASDLDRYVAILEEILAMNSMFAEVKRLRDFVLSLRASRPAQDEGTADNARPVAWMKGHRTHTPMGDDYDVELVEGRDPPEGDGWVPLYCASRPAMTGEQADALRQAAEALRARSKTQHYATNREKDRAHAATLEAMAKERQA